MRVLLVEDNLATAEGLKLLLELDGHEVIHAETPDSAAAVCLAATPDCVILDHFLPQQSGLDFLRWLRGQPDARRVRVLLTTAAPPDVLAEIRRESRGLESTVVLAKPYEPDALLGLLRVWHGAEACVGVEWTDYPPLRAARPGLAPPILAQVDSHVTNPGYWEAGDKGNWCHEGTHGCHADLRNRHGRPALYLGGDRCCLLAHPKTTIRAIAGLVPRAFRGFEYQTYCVSQAASWDSEPLYLWDEWAAYVNGARCETNGRQACRRVGDGRGYTLSEYLPVGLAVGLVDGLGAQERAVLALLLRLSAELCDRTHPYVKGLCEGAEGAVYRDRMPVKETFG